MKNNLDTLKESRSTILKELRNIDRKKLSTKWKVLYGVGYIGVIVITTILFFPDNIMLAFLLTSGYGVTMQALQVVLDYQKYKKLRKQLDTINKEIEDIEKEIKNKSLTDEERKKQILEAPYKPLKITEETRQEVLEHPELHMGCSVRVKMGKFYTNDEYEQRREEVLNAPLLGDKPKKKIRRK